MTYLTYEEYSKMGGVLDLTAFSRNIDRACGIIDNETHNRIECMSEIPAQAKALCRDLVEYLATNGNVNEKNISSKSESAGAVSESVSYTEKTANDIYGDIQNLLYDYLGSITVDNGTPLLYRGCMC